MSIAAGREAFRRRAWAEAFARLRQADGEDPLSPQDLERLATVARLLGREAEALDAWTRAHHGYVECDDTGRASLCAFWLASSLFEAGEPARAGGWISRARRLLDGRGECVEQGYLMLPDGLRLVGEGALEEALATFERVAEVAKRFGDEGLLAMGLHGQGRTLLRMGSVAEGVTLLDEVMVAMEVEELSPVVVGDLYCGVIGGCMEVFDLRRAQEWTAALGRWCDGQPDLVAYRGECLIRRAQLLQLGGAWQDALDEARRACSRLSDPSGQSGVGAAHYQRAELHRLRGELAEAEEGYRAASRRGTKPQPGLALLRLAQGRTAAAAAAVSLAVTEAPERRKRARLLPACVEISLAAGDAPSARAAAEELSELAMEWNAPYLRAVSAHAIGAVRLAEGDAAGALAELRQACSEWQRLDAPYEGARTRVLIGIAYRTLGDQDGAALELDAARAVFEGLGATGDVARVDELTSGDAPEPKDGLTPRERQVLSRVAAGETNRRIATGLGISERTVERHVSNILAKLQVASRTAAAAYAHRHHLT